MEQAHSPHALPPSEILVVGGRSYAFGLRWTSAASPSSLEEEALRAAEAEGASHVVIHRGYNQFGLGAIARPATGLGRWFDRTRAGIASVALGAGPATLAAFPLDDGRWLVLAIDRKGFLPDGDLIVADSEQAKARIDQLIARSPTSWRRIFVPESWGVPNGRSVNPAELLMRAGGPRVAPLWRLSHRRRIRFATANLAALLGAGGVAAIRIATAPAPPVIAAFQPPKPIAAVWSPAGAVIDRCLGGFRDALRYQAVPGWIPTKYSCQGGEGVSVTFTRSRGGQIDVIRALAPEARLSEDGLSAVLAMPLGTPPRVSATGAFVGRELYRLVGLDLAQRLNGVFMIQPARKALPGETDSAPPNQAWKLVGWTYQTEAPAPVWASAIARLGSIAIDTLTYSPSENLWQITGSLYASP